MYFWSWQEIGTATNFIVDDDMIDEFEESDGSDEEDDLFDSVCAICDNGGDILWYVLFSIFGEFSFREYANSFLASCGHKLLKDNPFGIER